MILFIICTELTPWPLLSCEPPWGGQHEGSFVLTPQGGFACEPLWGGQHENIFPTFGADAKGSKRFARADPPPGGSACPKNMHLQD